MGLIYARLPLLGVDRFFSSFQISCHETEMARDCRQKAIVVTHNPESFGERLPVVFCCHTFAEVSDDRQVADVDVMFRNLEAANTPFIIGRETI